MEIFIYIMASNILDARHERVLVLTLVDREFYEALQHFEHYLLPIYSTGMLQVFFSLWRRSQIKCLTYNA
jgi:hypothetical protein